MPPFLYRYPQNMYVCMYVFELEMLSPVESVFLRLSRMRLRSPELPPAQAAIWDYFMDKVPDWLWERYTERTGGKKGKPRIVKNSIGQSFLCMEIALRHEVWFVFLI